MTSPNPQESQQFPAQDYIDRVLADGSVPSQVNNLPAPLPTAMLESSIINQIQAVALKNAEEQIQKAAPALLKSLEDYAQQYTSALLAGKQPTAIPDIDLTNPDGSVTHLTQQDAKNRSFRTLLQGFGIDLIFALIAALGALSGVNFFDKAGLATLGILVSKTIIQTMVSYVARLKITPNYQK